MSMYDTIQAQFAFDTTVEVGLIEAQRKFSEANGGALPTSRDDLLEAMSAQARESIQRARTRLESVRIASQAHAGARASFIETASLSSSMASAYAQNMQSAWAFNAPVATLAQGSPDRPGLAGQQAQAEQESIDESAPGTSLAPAPISVRALFSRILAWTNRASWSSRRRA